jgi:ADP-ribose pyrophosphatase YjhB (NUDIX family)
MSWQIHLRARVTDPTPVQQVAAYAVICDGGGRVLLVRAGEPAHVPGTWFLPGAAVRHGEDPTHTATRAVAELTGYRCRIERLVAVTADMTHLPRNHEAVHTVRVVYRASVVSGSLRREGDDLTDASQWVELAEVRRRPLASFTELALAQLSPPG